MSAPRNNSATTSRRDGQGGRPVRVPHRKPVVGLPARRPVERAAWSSTTGWIWRCATRRAGRRSTPRPTEVRCASRSCWISASVDPRCRAGRTPPIEAARNGLAACKLLAKAGADLSAADGEGSTALESAKGSALRSWLAERDTADAQSIRRGAEGRREQRRAPADGRERRPRPSSSGGGAAARQKRAHDRSGALTTGGGPDRHCGARGGRRRAVPQSRSDELLSTRGRATHVGRDVPGARTAHKAVAGGGRAPRRLLRRRRAPPTAAPRGRRGRTAHCSRRAPSPRARKADLVAPRCSPNGRRASRPRCRRARSSCPSTPTVASSPTAAALRRAAARSARRSRRGARARARMQSGWRRRAARLPPQTLEFVRGVRTVGRVKRHGDAEGRWRTRLAAVRAGRDRHGRRG